MHIYTIYRAVALTTLLIIPVPMMMCSLTYNQKIACGLTASLISGYAGYTWLRTPEQLPLPLPQSTPLP